MWPRRILTPLTGVATYRRAVFLLPGGLLLAAYWGLAVGFARLLADAAVPRAVLVVLAAVAAGIAVAPLLLGSARALEIAAVRSLLDVEVPNPVRHRRIDARDRLRAAAWIGVHMVTGGLLVLGLITVLPAALVLTLVQAGVAVPAPAQPFGRLAAHHGVAATSLSLIALVLLVYGVAGLGAAARRLAPRLLGPSPGERIAALEAQAGRLAERDRLARELHDSIGHALTVTTLQAAAARELFDVDTEFARAALRTIEDSGRHAMEELDHVLGLLRERDPAERRAEPAPRTLADLDRLIAETRAAGVRVTATVLGPVGRLPATVSREGYRIVQEGLTNAARHAAGSPVTVHVDAGGTGLDLEVANPAAATSPRDPVGGGGGGGRGLAGMRERVELLGGRFDAGTVDRVWRIKARLPMPRRGGQ